MGRGNGMRLELVERIQLGGKITSLSANSSTNRVVATVSTEKGGIKDSEVIVFEASPSRLTEKLKLSVSSMKILEPYYDDTIELLQKTLLRKLNSSDPWTEKERSRMRDQYDSIKDQKGEWRALPIHNSRAILLSDGMLFVAVSSKSNIVAVIDSGSGSVVSKLDVGNDYFHKDSLLTPFLFAPGLAALPFRTGLNIIEIPTLKSTKVNRNKNDDYVMLGAIFQKEEGRLYMLWGKVFGGLVQTYTYNSSTKKFAKEHGIPTNEDPGFEAKSMCANPEGGAIVCLSNLSPNSPNGLRLLTISNKKKHQFDLPSDWAISLGWHNHVECASLCICVDGRHVIFEVGGGLVCVNTQSGETKEVHKSGSKVCSLEYDREQQLLMAASEDGTLELLAVSQQ